MGRRSYEAKHTDRMARGYCTQVLSDARSLQNLQQNYSNRTMRIICDEYIQSPIDVAKKVLQFCSVGLSKSLETQLKSQYRNSIKEHSRKIDWKDFWNRKDISTINMECQDFFKEIQYGWLDTHL